MQKQKSRQLEGEGSYSAARRYDANVRKYREGIEDWVGAGLPTESS